MSNCVICIAVTRVVNYSSSFLTLEYSSFYISGCSFSQSLMNCWNLWKIGASVFHVQLASLETDLNNYIYMYKRECYAASSGAHHPFFVIGRLY